ncbi:hypothetical protein J0695_26585, partial [Streptomyces beijiangensis]|nr:hypothetical protein [Streptomyces beijiangensis]
MIALVALAVLSLPASVYAEEPSPAPSSSIASPSASAAASMAGSAAGVGRARPGRDQDAFGPSSPSGIPDPDLAAQGIQPPPPLPKLSTPFEQGRPH